MFFNNLFCFSTGISVSISTFSLVAIAIERYSAICNPLKSRVWQTRSHASRVIAATWVLAIVIMIPYPIISHLETFHRPDNATAHRCRHMWPLATAEQAWWVFRLHHRRWVLESIMTMSTMSQKRWLASAPINDTPDQTRALQCLNHSYQYILQMLHILDFNVI